MGELHSVVIRDRNNTELFGVTDVVSFDETYISLSTACGGMEIEGEGLHISVLDLSGGKVKVEGMINGIYYTDEREKNKREGPFARLFSR